jgi:hypothetical protein
MSGVPGLSNVPFVRAIPSLDERTFRALGAARLPDHSITGEALDRVVSF